MNLSDMTVPQLREIAAEHYVNGRSKMKKADLIDAIESHRKAEQDRAAERDAYLKMNDADRKQAQDEMSERNRPNKVDEVDLSDMATMLGRDVFGTVEEQAAYIGEGIEQDEAAEQADAEAGELLDAALGEPVEPIAETGQIAITKYAGHVAFATAALGDGSTVGAHITRGRGGRWALMYSSGHVIRAKTLGKAGKLWAKALGFHATTIAIDTMS